MFYRSRIVLTGLAISLTPITAFAGNASSGSPIFQEKCAACHGASGTAVLPGAPSFAKGERLEKTDGALKTTITNGKNAMPSFKGVLSDGQMGDVLAYIRTLKK